MAFRLRYQNKTYPISSTPDSTVEALMAEIRDVTGVFPSKQQISFGYPPQVLQTDAKSLPLTLLQAGMQKRDQLTLSERSANTRPTAPVHAASRLEEAIEVPIPEDNSCLFNSIAYLCMGSSNRGPELRSHVIQEIRGNPGTYTPSTLGCAADDYCKWIANPMHWGGYIEMEILSRKFDVEICVLYIEECKIVRVTNGTHKDRIFLTYDNIHYNAVEFNGFGVRCLKRVPIDDATAESLALEMVKVLNTAGKFVNTAKCNMRCDVCGIVVKGQKEAEEHGKRTGHANFSQSN
jgi:ubiquitin thioesterase OTU1